MPLFVKQEGTGPSRIALLHGFGGSHAAWSAVQPALAREATTLAYDLPGHGASFDYPDAGPAKVAAQAILADLAERSDGPVHLVGHSMGGAIATLIAMFDPARVASLTLLAPGGFGPEINHRLLVRFSEARDATQVRACLEAMTGWFSEVSEEAVENALMTRAEGRHEKLMAMAQGLAKDGRQGQLPRDKVAALPMPVTLVWGELDNVLPARHVRDLPAHFDIRIFPDLGHMLPDEAPAEMVEIIRQRVGLG